MSAYGNCSMLYGHGTCSRRIPRLTPNGVLTTADIGLSCVSVSRSQRTDHNITTALTPFILPDLNCFESTMALQDLSLTWMYCVVLGCILLFTIVTLIQNRDQRLNHIPGPLLAKFTDAWRAFYSYGIDRRTTKENWQMKLFRKYGVVVRVGPDTVLVNDLEAIPAILGFKERLEKVQFDSVRFARYWGEMLNQS